MNGFLEELRTQRWDDHRFYHQSRVNQSLHLFSACSFLATYVMLFTSPVIGAVFGWIVAMISRQIGHFFFEPKTYDTINNATFQYKEDVKVGYNLRRKYILLSIWALIPLALYISPSLFGLMEAKTGWYGYLDNLAQAWLVLAGIGLVFRTVHLFFIRGVKTGLVWFTKILTDPFHDIMIYHKAPFHLLKGEWLDPMEEVKAEVS